MREPSSVNVPNLFSASSIAESVTTSPSSISSEHHKEESNELDYNEDKDQLEEEQEEETGEIASVTINQVF
jgi:hypothetical protein